MDFAEQFHWYQAPALPCVDILQAIHNTTPRHKVHERYVLTAVHSAKGTNHYRGHDFLVGPNSLLLFEPGEGHTTRKLLEPGYYHVIFIPPDWVARAREEQGLPGPLHFPVAHTSPQDPHLFRIAERLAGAVAAAATPLELQSLMALCLQRLLAYGERAAILRAWSNSESAIRQVKAYLHAHCQEPVDLDLLSAISGLSRFGLVHAFTAREGMPPHAYQVHLRVERARTLLQRGMPPGIVAEEVGFADQSHFTRHFKRVFNITPGHYARLQTGVHQTFT